MPGLNSRFRTFILVCNQTVGVNPAIPNVGRCSNYQPNGVKAGMVRVWEAGKTVIPLLQTGHI